MSKICHFHIPTEDMERAKKFYTELFGWKIERVQGPMEYYMVNTTSPGGEKGVDGGMAKKDNPKQTTTNYIEVPSVDEYIAKVVKLGGEVMFPKTAVPNIGYTAVCLDTENNAFGLWETNENAK